MPKTGRALQVFLFTHKSYYLLNAIYMPGTVIRTLHASFIYFKNNPTIAREEGVRGNGGKGFQELL